MELRPYQRECLDSLVQRYRSGARRLLVSLPTGTGKTVIFAQFPRFFAMKKRLLVIAHRQELLEQALHKFNSVDPNVSVGIEQASRAAGDAQVVVASVQTLRGKRLAALDPEDFYLVVVDEAHHAVAPTYKKILTHLGLFDPDTRKLLVGFTATPRRGDRRGLGEVFQEIAFSKGIEEMIAEGFLCRIAGWRAFSQADLDGVKIRHGDFAESALAEVVDTALRNELLIEAYQRLAPGRRCIVFCVNVQHAQNVADAFRKAGLRAKAVWGAMRPSERADVLRALSAGELDVVTNCNVLTEGFDEPSIDCVLMARPTRSLALYVQMVGRGTRLNAGKEDLLVIDIVDNSRKHVIAGLNALFEIPADMDLRGADAILTASRLRELGRKAPWVDLSRLRSTEELKFAAERIEFFRLEPPEEIEHATEFTWLGASGGGYRLGLPGGKNVVVLPTLLGDWEIVTANADGIPGRPVGRARTAAKAVGLADAFVRRDAPDAIPVLLRSAAWRERAPTEKQLAVLQAKQIPIPKELTRGQASWLLAHALG